MSYAHTSKDPQHPKSPGATEDTPAKGSAAHHPSARRTQDAQAPPVHHSEEQQDQKQENKKTTPRVFGYARAFKDLAEDFMSSKPRPPQASPKDKYLQLLEECHRLRDENNQSRATIESYDRELRSRTIAFNDESQRYKDTINALQNELNDVHQQLEDAKALSEAREKKPFAAQVDDTLSIAEVGEKVFALNEENLQAATTLGEGLIRRRHEVSQTELEAAASANV